MNAFAVLLVAVIVLVSAVISGWRLLFHLAWLMFAVTLFSYLWTRLAFRGLAVLRDSTQTRVQVGDSLKERLGLRNLSVIPKLWLEVNDGGNLPGRGAGNVISIGPTAEKRWRKRTPCSQRGRYRVGPLTISSSDPFGLFNRSITVGNVREVLVFPQVIPLNDFALPALNLPGGNIAQRHSYQNSPTVTTVRDYEPGDSLNKVSWKTTARLQKLMVKEFDLDPIADVWIVLDLNRKLHVSQATSDRRVPSDAQRQYLNSTLEYSVTAAASVASVLLDRGRSVGLLTHSGERQVVLPDRGTRQLWKILELLADVEISDTPPLRELLVTHQAFFAGNHTLVVITPDTSGQWRLGLEVSGGRAVPVTAVYVDPLSFDPRLRRVQAEGDSRRGRLYAYLLRNGDDIQEKLRPGGMRTAMGEA